MKGVVESDATDGGSMREPVEGQLLFDAQSDDLTTHKQSKLMPRSTTLPVGTNRFTLTRGDVEPYVYNADQSTLSFTVKPHKANKATTSHHQLSKSILQLVSDNYTKTAEWPLAIKVEEFVLENSDTEPTAPTALPSAGGARGAKGVGGGGAAKKAECEHAAVQLFGKNNQFMYAKVKGRKPPYGTFTTQMVEKLLTQNSTVPTWVKTQLTTEIHTTFPTEIQTALFGLNLQSSNLTGSFNMWIECMKSYRSNVSDYDIEPPQQHDRGARAVVITDISAAIRHLHNNVLVAQGRATQTHSHYQPPRSRHRAASNYPRWMG